MDEHGSPQSRCLRAVGLQVLVGVTCLLLAACASIPLSTMWKLRSFGPEQLAAIDPGSLRVAVKFEPDWIRMQPGETRLTLTLHPHEGETQVHAWPMQRAVVAPPGLVPLEEDGWQLFRLTPNAADDVRQLAPLLDDAEARFGGAVFEVKFGLQDTERVARQEAIWMSVRLSLAADQEPFTLIDRARMSIAHTPASHPGGKKGARVN